MNNLKNTVAALGFLLICLILLFSAAFMMLQILEYAHPARDRSVRWNGLPIRALVMEIEARLQRHLPPVKREITEDKWSASMDWNRIEGNWKQFKGQAKEKWGRLTDDDLDVISGRQQQLEGKIQERYGLQKDQAKKDVEAWFRSLP